MKKIFQIVIAIIIVLGITSCGQSKNKTIDIYSYNIKNRATKMDTLFQYIAKEPEILDAEYHIWFQDNGNGRVPGPSDYSITMALKVIPDSIDKWKTDIKPPSELTSIKPWNELKLDPIKWKLDTIPEEYYSDTQNKVTLLYRRAGIVLVTYSSLHN